MALKAFIVIFFVVSGTIALGEVYLRNLSFYGAEYSIQLDENRVKKDAENELSFISGHTLDDLIKAEKDSSLEAAQGASNTYRIIILGDSIAEGWGLRKGELKFQEVMKDILRRKYPDVNFDILTCASGGWSTTQEVIAYKKYCENIRHNLVIVAYCQNDDAEAYPRIRKVNGRLLLTFYKTGIPYLSSIPFNKFFTERSLVARFVNERAIGLLQYYKFSPHIKYCLLRDDKIYRAFKKLYALTGSRRAKAMVVIFPYLIEREAAHDAKMSALIKKWCGEFGWSFIDLMEYYKSYGLEALKSSSGNPVHPNSLGHKIAAEIIVKEFRQ